ncbi:MAG: HAD family hydrolase [Acidimicrobiia bacterium]|nr:HAD family hydrolase [Acidimicrobiia bacterium]
MATEVVIFDCDGVLVDSEVIAIEVEAELLTAAGFALTVDDIADRFVGLSYRDMMAELASEFGRPVPDELDGRIQSETLASFPDRLRAVVGVEALLEQMQLARCVASSSDLDRIRLSLAVTALDRFFEADDLFSAQMVDNGKPAPDLFLHAAAKLGVDPRSCLVIEDSPHGVQAARRAEMPVIGFLGGGHARPSLHDRLVAAGADHIANHPQQILDHL